MEYVQPVPPERFCPIIIAKLAAIAALLVGSNPTNARHDVIDVHWGNTHRIRYANYVRPAKLRQLRHQHRVQIVMLGSIRMRLVKVFVNIVQSDGDRPMTVK